MFWETKKDLREQIRIIQERLSQAQGDTNEVEDRCYALCEQADEAATHILFVMRRIAKLDNGKRKLDYRVLKVALKHLGGAPDRDDNTSPQLGTRLFE